MHIFSTFSTITILTAVDQPLFRQGIASVVDVETDMRVVAAVRTGEEAVAAFRLNRPDVTLMDVRMPDMNGAEAIAIILGQDPQARIVVLNSVEHEALALRAIRAGGIGYLGKSSTRSDLIDTVRAVHSGHRRLPPAIAELLAAYRPAEGLSAREIAVLHLAGAGNTNRLIGLNLGIAEETVKAHMKHILAKLLAKDRAHAVMLALKYGIMAFP